MQVGQVVVDDFLDAYSGSGHMISPLEWYNGDVGRLKTPVFVIPDKM